MGNIGVLRKQDDSTPSIQVPLSGDGGAQLYTTLGGKGKQLPLFQQNNLNQTIPTTNFKTTQTPVKDEKGNLKPYSPESLIEQAGMREAAKPITGDATQEQVYDAATRGAEYGGKALDWGSKGLAGLRGLIALQRGTASGTDALSALGGAGMQAYTTHQMLNPMAQKTGANIGGRIGRNVAVSRGKEGREPSIQLKIPETGPVAPYVAPPSVHAGYEPPTTVPNVTETPLNFPTEKQGEERKRQMGGHIPAAKIMGKYGYPLDSEASRVSAKAEAWGETSPSIVPGPDGNPMLNTRIWPKQTPPIVASPRVASPTNMDNKTVQTLQRNLGPQPNINQVPPTQGQVPEQTIINQDADAINQFRNRTNNNTVPGNTGIDGS